MQRIVVKLGTSVLTAGTRRLHQPTMVKIARQCADLVEQGNEVIVVTSGAIAAGRDELDFPELPKTIASKQVLAAVGQNRLMQEWKTFFSIFGLHVGQMLLTRADVSERKRFLNAQDMLVGLLEQGIVPIVNENDAVAIEEIKVGDNDNLSALVAVMAEADLLILLTDQDGLYTADPRNNSDAELIQEIKTIDQHIHDIAGGSVSGLGVGGMATKIDSAEIATKAGVQVIIAKGTIPDVILRIANGETIGTRFLAQKSVNDNLRRWLWAGSKPSGKIIIDAGAVDALATGKHSLLPAGIVDVKGKFERGDTVEIVDQSAHVVLGRGIARYGKESLLKIRGVNSSEIDLILGFTYGKVAIHRNDMLLMPPH